MRKLVNISDKRLSLKQTSSSPPGLCEDLKFLTELFGNKDLEPEEEVESLEELKAELKDLGYDLSDLGQQMEALRRKLAGKLERRLTTEDTENTEREEKRLSQRSRRTLR